MGERHGRERRWQVTVNTSSAYLWRPALVSVPITGASLARVTPAHRRGPRDRLVLTASLPKGYVKGEARSGRPFIPVSVGSNQLRENSIILITGTGCWGSSGPNLREKLAAEGGGLDLAD